MESEAGSGSPPRPQPLQGGANPSSAPQSLGARLQSDGAGSGIPEFGHEVGASTLNVSSSCGSLNGTEPSFGPVQTVAPSTPVSASIATALRPRVLSASNVAVGLAVQTPP